MNALIRKCGLIAAALAVLLCATSGSRASVTLDLDTRIDIDNPGPNPAGTAPWLRAIFTDNGSGGVILDLVSLLQSSTEFVSEWDFNYGDNLSPATPALSTLVFTHQGGTTAATSISKSSNAFQADGDGRFDIQFLFNTSGSPSADPPRFEMGSTSQYLITTTSSTGTLSEDLFNFVSMTGGGNGVFFSGAHVQGTAGGGQSAWIGDNSGGNKTGVPDPNLPEPSTIVMAGTAALFGIGYGWRRRQRAAA